VREDVIETCRRVAEQHARAVDFYLYHASFDRLAGRDKLAAEMEKRAERERELGAEELRKAETAKDL
jgi:hypothetical protein